MAQVAELWHRWHHYYSLVVQWGMKLCFTVVRQARWEDDYWLVTLPAHGDFIVLPWQHWLKPQSTTDCDCLRPLWIKESTVTSDLLAIKLIVTNSWTTILVARFLVRELRPPCDQHGGQPPRITLRPICDPWRHLCLFFCGRDRRSGGIGNAPSSRSKDREFGWRSSKTNAL